MAEPSFVAAGTYLAGSAANAAVAVPAGTADGRFVAVTLFMDGAALSPAPTPPAGFQVAPGAPILIASGSGAHSLYVWWKRLTGADAGTYTFTWTGSRYREAIATLWQDVVATGDPWDLPTDWATDLTSATVTPPVDVTSLGPDRRLIWAATNWGGGTWTAPSGFTKRAQGGAGVHTICDRSWPTASNTGNITGTCTGNDKRHAWLGALIGTTPDAVAVEGELDTTLPAIAGQAAGTVIVRGLLSGGLPALGGTLTGHATVTGATTALLPPLASSLTGTAPPRPAAELRDTFAAPDLDTSRWTATNSAGVTGAQTDGAYAFEVDAAAVAYSQLTSAGSYDLTGSAFTVELVDAGSQAAGLEAYFIVEADTSNRLVAVVAGGFLGIYKTVSGSQSGITFPTYDPIAHRWLRIREEAGTTYWEAAADGADWTVLHFEATPITVTATRLILQAGAWQALGADATVVWDNVGGTTKAVLDGQLPALAATLTATTRADAALDAALPALTAGLAGAATTRGPLTGTLGAVGAELAGAVTAHGPFAAALPPLGANLAATVRAAGELPAQLPALGAHLDGAATATGQADSHLPALTGALAAAVTTRAALDATLPALTGALQGTVETAGGQLAAVLPPLAGTLTGSVRVAGAAAAALPTLGAALQGEARAVGALAAALPALGASVQGEVILPAGPVAARLPALAASFSGASAGVAPPDPMVRPGPPRLGWPTGGVSVRQVQASPPRPRWRVGVPLLGGDE